MRMGARQNIPGAVQTAPGRYLQNQANEPGGTLVDDFTKAASEFFTDILGCP